MSVHRNKPKEYFYEEGCFITERWNTPSDADVSLAEVRVEPGVTTRFHCLECTCERYLITDGEGLVETGDDKAAPVCAGDVVVIPPGVRQRITNKADRDLRFLAVCTPRFIPENYRDCEAETDNACGGETPMPVIETYRLVLRPFRLSDAADLQRLAGDFAVADTTAAIPHPYPDGAAQDWINTHEREFVKKRMLALAVTLKGSGELAGCISIMNVDAACSSGELGYWIAGDLWGRGYCTEAASAIVGYGFDSMGLNRICSTHLARNPASGRVMQKIGMVREGYQRQAFQKWDKREDMVLYAMLKEDRIKGR